MTDQDTYTKAGVNVLIHMGAITPDSLEEGSGQPEGDSLFPLATTMGFYVTTAGGPESTLRFNEVDPDNEYSINSWGCRDEDYTSPADVLAAGCSMTFGQGVPVETRWSSVLGSKLNMSVATLAIPGWSTQSSVNAVMSYIKKFGKPKVVALYLPDFFRYDFIASSGNLLPSNQNSREGRTIQSYLAKGTVLSANQQPTYSKKPHAISDVFNSESAHFLSGQALRFLVEYCKEAGIQLVYGTWHPAVDEYIKLVKKADAALNNWQDKYVVPPEIDLSGYVDMEMFYPKHIPSLSKTTEYLEDLDCHQDLKSQYGTYFDWGTDRDKHIGVHAHAHVAEKFLAALNLE